MNTEHERIKFEAACHSHAEEAGHEGTAKLERDGDGYADPATQAAWWGWREARAALQSQDREDAERYRWVKRHAHPNRGFDEWCLPCVDYVDDNLDAAIDHAHRIEGEGK